jgi:hypothetical protein
MVNQIYFCAQSLCTITGKKTVCLRERESLLKFLALLHENRSPMHPYITILKG